VPPIPDFANVNFAKADLIVRIASAMVAGLMLWANSSLASVSTPFELRATWGICGNGKFADGTLTLNERDLTASLKLLDGERASFSTLRRGNGTFEARFQIGSGDGFEIEGRVEGSAGQGKWKSPTLSCGGDWQTKL